MKLDTLTVQQFNDIVSDFDQLAKTEITSRDIIGMFDEYNELCSDAFSFMHTLVYVALNNYFQEDESDEFYDAYYTFSVRA